MAIEDSAPLPDTDEYREQYQREIETLRTLRADELSLVLRRLSQIAESLRSMRRLAVNAICCNDVLEGEAYAIALSEMARANFKGLDAVMIQLGEVEQGNWREELAAD